LTKKLTHVSFYIINDIHIALSVDPLMVYEFPDYDDINKNEKIHTNNTIIGKNPLLVMYKPFNEELTDKRCMYKQNNLTNINDIIRWIEIERFPLITMVSPLNFMDYKERQMPIVWLSVDKQNEQQTSDIQIFFRPLARHYKGLLSFLMISPSDHVVFLNRLGILTMPGMMIEYEEHKYLFDSDINPMEEDYSAQFLEAFFQNELPRYIKSQSEEEIEEDITFDEEILQNSDNLILDDDDDDYNRNKSNVKYINGYKLFELIENGTPYLTSIYTNEEINSFKHHLWSPTNDNGDNNDWINDIKLNVMVLYYTTWDTRCNKIVSVYENIAKYWAHHNRTIVLTKINIMSNDICDTMLFYHKLPIIALYKHDSISCKDAVLYHGKRREDVIIKWIKINLNISIDKDEEEIDEQEFYDDRDEDANDNLDPFYNGAKQQD